jgi:hypothetical protein
MRETLYKLQNNVQKSNGMAYQKLNEVKKKVMGDCLKKLYINAKKSNFGKLKSNMIRCRQIKRVTVIHTIVSGAEKRNLLYAINQLKFKKASNNK